MTQEKREQLLDALEKQFSTKLSPIEIIDIIKIVEEIYDCPTIR